MKKNIFILAISLIAMGRVLGQTCNSGLAGCTTCAMGDAFDCTACRKGFILVTTAGGKGQCTRCFDGTGSLGGTATLCAVTCEVGCETCTDVPTQCLLCRAGFLWKTGQTCQRCPDGTGKSGDANEILSEASAGSCSITCPRPCNNCDGATPTKCVNCVAGFYWAGKAAGTCDICTGRKGKAIDSVDKTTQVAADTCGITCTGGCEACDQTQSKCLNCRGGYFWTGTTCTLCSAGKGKAADTVDKTGLVAESCGVVCTAGCEACSDTTNYCLNCKAGYR